MTSKRPTQRMRVPIHLSYQSLFGIPKRIHTMPNGVNVRAVVALIGGGREQSTEARP